MTPIRGSYTPTDANRWSRLLAISAAVMSCAFLGTGTALWLSQRSLISSSDHVTNSFEAVKFIDGAEKYLSQNNPREFQSNVTNLNEVANPDAVRTARLKLFGSKMPMAFPNGKKPADPETKDYVAEALRRLGGLEQFRLDYNMAASKAAGEQAQTTLDALLFFGALLLLAGQAALWMGIRNQRRDQKQLEALNANLNLARREALALSDTKGRFLADMSHEIRTPLNGIVGMASMLSLRDLSPEDSDILRTIRSSSDVLLRVVDDVLDLSKIDSNRVQLVTQPLELNALLRDVSTLYKGMAEANRDVMELDIPGSETWVLGDAVRLKQIFGNLVSNAVKFCREGKVTISLDSPVPGTYRIKVSDTGVGIASDRLEDIFDEFVQAQISVSQEHPGTGLGLAIARKLVRRMGGEISVTSQVGSGSEFQVVVPLTSCPPTPVLKSAQPPVIEGMRILLAEDNNVNILVATAILQRAGCSVEVARDGSQAVDMAMKGDFDVVLMDLRMPNLPGTEASLKILKSFEGRQHVPKIVAMTANASPEDRAACEEAGMVGFLSKPFTYEQLVETLGAVAPVRV